MSDLPYDILEKIASYADADSRRAMRFPPRKLNKELLEKVHILISKKYNSYCYNKFNDINSSLFIIDKVDDITTAVYFMYNFSTDIFTIIHIKGHVSLHQSETLQKDPYFFFDRVGRSHILVYSIFDTTKKYRSLNNYGVLGYLSRYNYEQLLLKI